MKDNKRFAWPEWKLLLVDSSRFEEFANSLENSKKHRIREASSESILLAGMIGAKEPGKILREIVLSTVAKGELGNARDEASVLQHLQIGFQSDSAKYKNRL